MTQHAPAVQVGVCGCCRCLGVGTKLRRNQQGKGQQQTHAKAAPSILAEPILVLVERRAGSCCARDGAGRGLRRTRHRAALPPLLLLLLLLLPARRPLLLPPLPLLPGWLLKEGMCAGAIGCSTTGRSAAGSGGWSRPTSRDLAWHKPRRRLRVGMAASAAAATPSAALLCHC